MKWRDYVIEALENLGGRSHLELIYKEVERLRSRDSLDAPHLMEQVRRELETHSSSSFHKVDLPISNGKHWSVSNISPHPSLLP